ncbi:MAG: PIN domain-containing protein [Deltaproteobacteria bacterium]|jgi:ribonuclease VapC|nr:PIN domain-containing protein [Deltaproteobacteria bacterium]MDA8306766.1 PIN domain-containing protein [Deltaproteobacteria bacterium]
MRIKKKSSTDSFLFDTSALLTLWNDEEGADLVEDILRSGARVCVSFMSCMEGRYRIWKNADKAESDEFARYLDLLPLEKINVTDAIFEKSIEIKATKNLSVCDSWIAATAFAENAVLLHKDPGFEQVKTIVKLRSLPLKSLKPRRPR